MLPFCLHISGMPVVNSNAFKEGYISIQDKSSMMVAYVMNLGRDDKVLDAAHLVVKLVIWQKFFHQKVTSMQQIFMNIK